MAAFEGEGRRVAPGINVRLYQHLAQRWLGPVGWLVAVWTRILVFGTGIASLLVFNLPVLAILGYAGWLTAVNFFSGTILSGDFFLHAFWTIILVLLLSFFLLQGVIRLSAGKDRLTGRVFNQLREAANGQDSISESPVWRQAKIILTLVH
ncbi:hypothetical protein [Desulfosarcina variabilis]|uniref:hypothetical protein n=1 Tax=Desulfosarcina variabilis TaxID=2300 RepID=UPI003AFA206C